MEPRKRIVVLAIYSTGTCLGGGRELRVGGHEASFHLQRAVYMDLYFLIS